MRKTNLIVITCVPAYYKLAKTPTDQNAPLLIIIDKSLNDLQFLKYNDSVPV